MTRAISNVSEKINIEIKEFTVAGIPFDNRFAHKWYIGTNDIITDKEAFIKLLDQNLSTLNDDYAVERKAALKNIFVEIVPLQAFYDWLKMKGKEGGQHKFPRVIGAQFNEWESFICQYQN